MNEGWKCPECGKCYAPWVGECRNDMCGVVVGGGTTITVNPILPQPWEDSTTTTEPIPGVTYWPNTWGHVDAIHEA